MFRHGREIRGDDVAVVGPPAVLRGRFGVFVFRVEGWTPGDAQRSLRLSSSALRSVRPNHNPVTSEGATARSAFHPGRRTRRSRSRDPLSFGHVASVSEALVSPEQRRQPPSGHDRWGIILGIDDDGTLRECLARASRCESLPGGLRDRGLCGDYGGRPVADDHPHHMRPNTHLLHRGLEVADPTLAR